MLHEIVFDSGKLSAYKRGRISGMSYIITSAPEKQRWGWGYRKEKNEWVWLFEATDEQYRTLIRTVEKAYPGIIKYERINESLDIINMEEES